MRQRVIARLRDAVSGVIIFNSQARRAAAFEFMREMMEEEAGAAGNELSLNGVRYSYDALRKDRGWPSLSDLQLAKYLVQFGCQPKMVRRHHAGAAPGFVFPTKLEVQL